LNSFQALLAVVVVGSALVEFMLDQSEFHLRERVARIIQQLLLKRSVSRLVSAEDSLRQIGLTSLDMVSLMLAVEAEFGVQIPDRDMTPSNFQSISSIEKTVADLLAP
jgi:acyl carrier protein